MANSAINCLQMTSRQYETNSSTYNLSMNNSFEDGEAVIINLTSIMRNSLALLDKLG